MRDLLGPWLADIAGNFLAVVIIVLVVVSRAEPPTGAGPAPTLLQATAVETHSGAAAVELLRQRLLTSPDISVVDLTPDTTELPDDLPRPPVLFILHPVGHAVLTRALKDQGVSWQELTIPDALKTPQDQWSPGFLHLAPIAADKSAFLDGLQALLIEGHQPQSGGWIEGEDTGQPETISTKLARWLVVGKRLASLALLGLFMLGFLGVRRWAIKA